MLDARDPDLLAVDHITVAFFDSRGFELRGVGAGRRFGHGHRLQAQFTRGNFGQVKLLLFCRAVAQQRPHVVHLAVAGARVAAGEIDFFHDHRGFGEAQTRASVFQRNQRRQPASLGQRVDKRFRVGALVVHFLPVRGVKSAA